MDSLWGNPDHLWYIASALRQKYSEDKLHILVPQRNAGSFTYDGIELGGERVTQEIEQTLEELATQGRHIRKISVMGYSLGGLVARYAVGLLYSKGYFRTLTPVNFTTFASPHLGVRTPLLGFHNHMWNVMGARLLSMSGRQLFGIDSFRDTGRPLLSVLADPDSIFIKALASFKHRSLYTNIVNDRSTVHYTTGITRTDPYANLKAIKVNYLPGYEDVILDPENPISPHEEEGLQTWSQKIADGAMAVASRTAFTALFAVVLTVGIPVFFATSLVQTIRSSRRIRLHNEGKLGIDVKEYQVPLVMSMVREARQTAEDFFENVNQAQSQEYLPAGTEEVALEDGSMSPVVSPMLMPKHGGAGSVSSGSEKSPSSLRAPEGEDRSADFPILALTPNQFSMIQALDDVGFKKYPVWIHKARHSHAAIIVRMNRDSFSEGKVVVKHWLDHFEI